MNIYLIKNTCFNINIIECKSGRNIREQKLLDCFNINIIECKLSI